ncbi:hypothetical protein CGCSCA4_v002037 [Colletotrichum siamense]|uniref:Uncharacterized protein n=1 Tax=Colletotrichum siamense TaxID=690259 RepID=A0A9P5F2I1_COLSI|nr:hypothetical protein CGCSCA4_v002037 [Colletotrichum siamense]KAF4864636.1 hypothetical protein CGCSCA2_v002172 [Colletotrichum siamense]
MYPHAAMAAERDPHGLEHFWGKLLKRGVRFELTGNSDLIEEDIITRNELVQTPEGLMIRFTDQVCRCYLDPIETERKRMMEEMGFGSQCLRLVTRMIRDFSEERNSLAKYQDVFVFLWFILLI